MVKSRDLHWGLLATRDHRDINLSSMRMLLVADGANPWSLSSCDQFLAVFQSKGLGPSTFPDPKSFRPTPPGGVGVALSESQSG